MTATVIAIITFIVVFAIIVVGVAVFLRLYRKREPVKVDRDFAATGPGQRRIVADPHAQGGAGNAQRSMAGRRINAFSVITAAVLGVLAIKAWSLQILSGSQYASEAEGNMTAVATLPANRGRILDRKGRELVSNRASRTVVGKADVINDRRLVQRLAVVLGVPSAAVRARLMDETSGAQSDRVIASDVSMRAVSYIEENPTVFPGVSVETRARRVYPYGALACHVLGYSGAISEEELAEEHEGFTYESGDIVGKSGVEAAYERVLQGTKGQRTFKVNSSGETIALLDEIDPDPGNDVKLTIDLDVQRTAELALEAGMSHARGSGKTKAFCGAIVALDVKTGAVLASASAPTFNPNDFIGGISSDLWETLNGKDSNYPMTNRVLAGQYPAASTFKAFTGLASLSYGVVDNETKANCQGTWYGMGREYPKKCWLLSGHGELDIYEAIAQSCDVYFYEAAKKFYEMDDEHPDALQEYLKQWGFGAPTGIDLGGEASGRVPDAAWKAEAFRETPEDARWVPGDLANMVIGQGDILVTPLQIAAGYAGIATGKLLKPHVLYQVLNKDGQVVVDETIREADQQPEYTEENIQTIRDALHLVSIGNGGASSVFAGFPINVAAKSGTGETGSEERDDYAWFAAYAPLEDPQYCCACVVEQGGGGTATAGPPVRAVLAKLLGLEEDTIVVAQGIAGER